MSVIRGAAVAALAFAVCLPLRAQESTHTPAPPEQRWERWLNHLQKHLELTSQQRDRIRTLLRERWEQQQRERRLFRERLQEILSPEQWQKWQQLRQERRKRWQQYWKERGPRSERETPYYEK